MDLQALDTLHMHQKITMMVNRYEFFADNGEGSPGAPIAFAEQRRAKLREEVTVHTGPEKGEVLARFHARKVIDLGSGYEITDDANNPIGGFRKKFRKSLLNSTWHLEAPGEPPLIGTERSKTIAILRRIWDFIPYIGDIPFPMRYHFDFVPENGKDTTDTGQPSLSVNKMTWVRDHYRIDIADPVVDRRLVIAQAIAIDALQSR